MESISYFRVKFDDEIAVLSDQIVASFDSFFDHYTDRLSNYCVQYIYDELPW